MLAWMLAWMRGWMRGWLGPRHLKRETDALYTHWPADDVVESDGGHGLKPRWPSLPIITSPYWGPWLGAGPRARSSGPWVGGRGLRARLMATDRSLGLGWDEDGMKRRGLRTFCLGFWLRIPVLRSGALGYVWCSFHIPGRVFGWHDVD